MDKLIKKIIEMKNPTVAGLDPVLDYIPDFIKSEAAQKHENQNDAIRYALTEFNKRLIDCLAEVVPAVKPQSAYYEMYGIGGIMALHDTVSYAKKKGMYVILDVKRNDIGSTAGAYSRAYLGMTSDISGKNITGLEVDSITVNPYLGTDGIKPFAEDCREYGKSIFALVKTSNPSSGELQDLLLEGGKTVYERVAELVNAWGADSVGKYGFSSIGAVTGATYPEQITKLRSIMPHTCFLVPGYGAQGGTAADVAGAFNKDGLGAIVNSSRGIMCAYKKTGCDEKKFAEAARDEAVRMRNDILSFIPAAGAQ